MIDTLAAVQATMARFSDGADHDRRRAISVRRLRALDPARLRGQAEHVTRRRRHGLGDVDVMRALARHVPVAVLAGALGVADTDGAVAATRRLCLALAPPAGSPRGSDPEAATALRRLLAPAVEQAGEEEAVNTMALLVQAMDATAGLIGNTVVAAHRHGLGQDHAALVAEGNRHDPAVQLTTRMAAAPLTVGGCVIPAGARIVVLLAAANRDEARYPRPDVFDATRRADAFTFGAGTRPCPGRAHASRWRPACSTALRQRRRVRSTSRSRTSGGPTCGSRPICRCGSVALVSDTAYAERRPAPDLRADVACVWTGRIGDGGERYTDRILPDGCIDIVWNGAGLLVAGPDTGPVALTAPPGITFVGIRFVPGHAPGALGVPASALRDQRVDLEDLWGTAPTHAIAERLAGTAPHGAAALLEAVVRERMASADAADRVVDGLVAGLDAAAHAGRSGPGLVSALAARLGVSERSLHRRCSAAVGYGPKTLDRVLRFRRALRVAGAAPSLGALAAGAGYADQAHFTRECRRLAGQTPSELFKTGA